MSDFGSSELSHHKSQNGQPIRWTRRAFHKAILASSAGFLCSQSGCLLPTSLEATEPDAIWGRRGLSDGRLLKPRAMAIDGEDQLYLVDTTGRIQVFDVDGKYLRGWKMPETTNGRPTGLSVDHENHLLVADTHYFRMMVFKLDGTPVLSSTIGGQAGHEPGQFAFVTDAVRDASGVYYIGEYGDSDRLQRFDPDGRFMDWWGGTGSEPGQFVRPQSLILDPAGTTLYVADACNHRIQIYDVRNKPELIACWGTVGPEPGQLYYPYDLVLAKDNTLYICEYGNQRVQHFTKDGTSLGTLGSPGHDPGQFYQPWGLVLDSRGRLFVLDSNNHRVQRFVI